MKTLAWWVVLAGAPLAPATAAAQVDYRNLDDDRPVRVEDAQSVEAYAFELILPYAVADEREGGVVHAFVPELSYGLMRDLHVGAKAPMGVHDGSAGLSGIRLFALYNLNTEFGWFPAVALRADAELPVGPFGASDARYTLKGIATRAFGANRLHVNAARRLGGGGTPGLVESLPDWWVGVAADRTLYRESLLLVAEVLLERSAEEAPLATAVGGGVRWQWTPTAVLDVGVSRTLSGDSGHDVELSFGVTHVFGVRALMPGAR
jgi:hypothetical protein